MSKVNFIKMPLDIAMAVVFVLLFNKRLFTGLSFHEIAGLALGVAFIIHVLLNWKWVRAVTLRIFSKISTRARIGYVIDVLLLISMGFIIFSGLTISTTIPLHINVSDPQQFYKLHVAVSYISLLLLGIHVGLHWNWAMAVFRTIFHVPQNARILNYTAKVMAVLVLVYGCYAASSMDYFTRATSFTVSSAERQQLELKKSLMESLESSNSVPDSIQDKSATNGNAGVAKDQSKEQAIAQTLGSGKRVVIVDKDQSPDANSIKSGKPVKIVEGDTLESLGGNVAETISRFIAIIAAFAVITYYVERILTARKAIVTRRPVATID